MSSNNLTTNELAVLESLKTADDGVSQRELARRTGLSLGLINAVMKKLVKTGYVKTSRLDQRSLDYLLTQRGFTETASRSYSFLVDTVRRYKNLRDKLLGLIDKLATEGVSEFYLHGDGELAELVMVFAAEDGRAVIKRELPADKLQPAVIFSVAPVAPKGKKWRVVDLVRELGIGNKGDCPR